MPAEVTINIEPHVLDVRTGIWCDHCGFPSIIEADVAIALSETLRVISWCTYRACTTKVD